MIQLNIMNKTVHQHLTPHSCNRKTYISTNIESSHLFSVARDNPATATCRDETLYFFQSIFFVWPPYFNQPDAKSKDIYRREIICIGSTA